MGSCPFLNRSKLGSRESGAGLASLQPQKSGIFAAVPAIPGRPRSGFATIEGSTHVLLKPLLAI